MPYIEEVTSSPSQNRSCADEERLQRIRIKNRRKLYLDHNPSYLTSTDLELSDPLLYDRCIRRFQTAAEREANGKARGYAGVLEADLYRSEAKLAALKTTHPATTSPSDSQSELPTSLPRSELPSSSLGNASTIRNSSIELEDEAPKTKEEGLERWQWEMSLRFLRGEDQDFDYENVDQSEEWDDELEGRDEEEKWFEDEEPEWIASSGEEGENGSVKKAEKNRTGGETGIQDF